MDEILLKERCEKWLEWRELCVEAEKRKEQGDTEMVVPIDLILLARDIPKSMDLFYQKFFKGTKVSQ